MKHYICLDYNKTVEVEDCSITRMTKTFVLELKNVPDSYYLKLSSLLFREII